jgi:competence protein ComEC
VKVQLKIIKQAFFLLFVFMIVSSCAKQTTESPNQAPLFFEIPSQSARSIDGEFALVPLDSFVQDESPLPNLVWSVNTSGVLQASIDSDRKLHVAFPEGTETSQMITLKVRDPEGLEASQSVRFTVYNMQSSEVFAADGTMEIHRTVSAPSIGVVYYSDNPFNLNRHARALGGATTSLVVPLKTVESNTIYFYRWEISDTNGVITENSSVDSFHTATVTPPPLFRMTTIDVKQGDSHLIRTPGGKMILIDGGYGTSSPSFANNEPWGGMNTPYSLNYLVTQHVTHINAMVETHHHGDHYLGLNDVTNAAGITSDLYISCSSPHGLTVGSNWDIGDPSVTVKVLNLDYPEGVSHDNENNRSIVLKWTFGAVSYLTTGDAEVETQARIIARFPGEVNCDVLKVDHHGSYNGTTDSWAQATSPIFAVISCGAGNPYGHPHSECIDALNKYHATILRTDIYGNIDVITDGRSCLEAWY